MGVIGAEQGSNYHLDNVRLSPVFSAAQGLQVAWKAPDLGGINAVSWRMDQNPNPAPLEATSAPDQPLKLAKVTDFAGYLSLRVRNAAGNWSETVTRRVLVDSVPPAATIVTPANGERCAPETLQISLRDLGASGVDPSSIVLTVAGNDYRVDDRVLRYDYGNNLLIWTAGMTSPRPLLFTDGQKVEVSLKSARDCAGNSVATLPQWSWTMDFSKDKQGPKLASLVSPSHPTFIGETFESGAPGQVTALSGCAVQVLNQGAASGQFCAAIRKTTGPMQARLVGTEFPADKYPMLSFDYRLNNQVRVNLVAEMNVGKQGPTRFIWALTGPAAGAVGQVPGVQADGQWHKAFVNLAPALRNANQQGALIVSNLYLMEMGGGTPVGGEVALDNLIVAAAGYGPVVFRWSAADPTGIKGYSYVLTQNPAELPPATPTDLANQHTFDTPAPGVWFLRLRAQDGAGNWGGVETYAVINRNPV